MEDKEVKPGTIIKLPEGTDPRNVVIIKKVDVTIIGNKIISIETLNNPKISDGNLTVEGLTSVTIFAPGVWQFATIRNKQ